MPQDFSSDLPESLPAPISISNDPSAHSDARPGDEIPVSNLPSQKPARAGGWTQMTVFFFMLVILSTIQEWRPETWLWAYVAALMFVNYVLPWLGLSTQANSLKRRQRCVIGLLLATPLLFSLGRAALENQTLKTLAGAREFVIDKWRLQKSPCIFPSLVRLDQPQRFFIHSPGSLEVTARFSPEAEPLPTENLGHGLFMFDFDPRTAMKDASTGPLQIELTADGAAHARSLHVVGTTPHPRWFASSPSHGIAATVSEETDELILIHREGEYQRIDVDDGPTDCALFAGGTRVAVSHRYSPELCIVDVTEGTVVARHDLSRFMVRVATSPDETILAVALQGPRQGIQFLSLPDLRMLAFIPLPFAPDWIVFGRDQNELVATDRIGKMVHRIRVNNPDADLSARQWTLEDKPIQVARPVVTVCRASSGSEIIFSSTSTELNHEPIEANHFIEDAIHHLDLESWEVVKTYPTHRGGLTQDEPGTTDHGASPMGMTTFGDSLLIAFAGTNEVATASSDTGATLRFQYIDDEPLSAPHGVADLGGGFWCVSSPVDSTIGIYNEMMEIQHLVRLAPDEAQLEIDDPRLLEQIRGERTFYESTRSGVSCQSCHLHTRTDYSEHSIGATELVGVLTVHGIAGTSPYLRDGSYPQLIGLHSVVLDVYRDYEVVVEWDRAQALASYMNSLPPETNWRNLEPHDSDRMRAGMDAFVKAECIHCHVPPAMSNLSQHPTKVLFPEYGSTLGKESGIRNFLDVPHLRSVSTSPPYLHNGRAATLESIFEDHNPSARHGDTSSLSDDQFSALIYLLKQL